MKDEEKMNPLPVNNEDYESIYKLLGSILFEHGEPSHYLGYLESLYQAAKKSRPAEKLVPLDEEKVEELIHEYLTGDYEGSDQLAKAICARFGSVPVVPVVVFPEDMVGHDPYCGFEAGGKCDCGHEHWNARGKADKAAFDKAVKERNI